MMIALECLLLGCMASAAVICSVSDIRKGIVSNWVTLSTAIVGLVLQLIYCLIFAKEYALIWLLCMALSDIFAVLMYGAGLWAAGDVKLFAALYLCIPGKLIADSGIAMAIVPYFYIFIPAMIWLAVDSVWLSLRHAQRYSHDTFGKAEAIHILLLIFQVTVVQACISVLLPSFVEENGLFCSVLMLVYAYWASGNAVLKSRISLLIHAIVLGCAFLFGGWRWHFGTLSNYVLVILVMVFVRWASGYNYRTIKTSDVQKGMILSTATVLSFQLSRVVGLPKDASEDMSARLTQQEAESVRRWEKSSKGKPEVVIVRKIPFAIFIGVGYVLWMLIRMMG